MSGWNITLDPVNPQPTQERFLRAFYRSENDTLFLRAFSDRKDGFKGKNFTSTFINYKNDAIELKKQNELFRGIGFVVNGGGQNDKAVLASGSCHAQFMEIDDFKMEYQIKIINAFPLKPSIIVKTRKSLHVYWLVDDNADIKKYRSIQIKFVALFGSDPAIQNESRVMRLPGFYHNKEDPVMVEIIHYEPDLMYSQDEIEAAIDSTTLADLLDLTDLPADDKNQVLSVVTSKRKTKKKTTSGASDNSKIETGNRHTILISEIGRMKSYGFDNSIIKGAIIKMNEEQCADPLSEEELEQTVFPVLDRWSATEAPGVEIVDPKLMDKLKLLHPEMNKNFKWNDKGNGSLFAEVFKNVLRWNATAKKWYFYDGKKWCIDEDSMMAHRCAKQLTDTLMIYSLSIEDENIKLPYQKHINKLGQRNYRNTMIEDSKDSYFVIRDDFDKDDYLLNLQNGVLDLRSFELMKHDPSLLLSKICNVSYNPGADGTKWNQFIYEVMQGNQDKIDYLQKILGYSLTGITKEETCYILYGQTTRNGKSTLVETIAYMLGNDSGYSMNMRPESLAMKRNADSRQASSDIARLKDCRFLNVSEPPKKMLLDVGLLKIMTGRDAITARFLNENEFQFFPNYKLFINTNFLPLVTDDSPFRSGRFNVITFDRHFSEEEQNKNLKDELTTQESLSGVLNWCLEGLKKYYKEGAEAPDCVKAATMDYRNDSDKIGCFISEELIQCKGSNISGSEVYELYEKWCDSNGFGTESSRSFYTELRAKNLLSEYGTVKGKTVKNVLKGYCIKDEQSEIIEYVETKVLPFK